MDLRDMVSRWIFGTIFFLILFKNSAIKAQEQSDSVSLADLNQQLDNPLSRYWSLILQDNINRKEGTTVNETFTNNTLFFQPSLPIPVGSGKMLLVRPVFPLVTAPEINSDGSVGDYRTGFGDIQVFSLYGPDKKGGLIWGAGLTFIFPTATADALGDDVFVMGPALMLLNLSKKWTAGTIIQYWNDVFKRTDIPVSEMDIQYIIRRQIRKAAMSIGMGPSIKIDFNAPPGERVQFPIGLGITKTSKIGKTPIKWRIEPQYTIVRPESLGTTWTLRIQIAPIVKNPFL